MDEIPGNATSFWVDSTPKTNFTQLKQELKVDVAVLGGGITGLTTAIMLKNAGKNVAVLEADRIIEDVTSTTTAKVSAHIFFYSNFLASLGEYKARMYAQANMKAVKTVANLISEYNIDCDFRRVPCYIYSEFEEDMGLYKREAEVAVRLGLPVSYIEDVSIPSSIKAGVVYRNQAEFHPRRIPSTQISSGIVSRNIWRRQLYIRKYKGLWAEGGRFS